ncbi:MAG: MFS transporter, partial [Deltaproteobacteria bacterium]|nr:MFS transporter [Deltaproteobacteria bacterium]
MIRNDFKLDYTQAGWVISAFNLSYGLGQLPGGWLADRIGPRIIMTIGICGLGAAGLGVGFSQSFGMMIFFLVLMGVLGGGYHPAAPPMISASVKLKDQGRALGLHMIGGSASFFLAPLIATAISSVWNWRGSFISLAVMAILFGGFFYTVLTRREMRQAAQSMAIQGDPSGEPHPFPLRTLVSFIFLTTFLNAVITSSISFIPLLLVDHFNYSKETAGALFALIYSAGLWVSPLGGYLS